MRSQEEIEAEIQDLLRHRAMYEEDYYCDELYAVWLTYDDRIKLCLEELEAE